MLKDEFIWSITVNVHSKGLKENEAPRYICCASREGSAVLYRASSTVNTREPPGLTIHTPAASAKPGTQELVDPFPFPVWTMHYAHLEYLSPSSSFPNPPSLVPSATADPAVPEAL